MNRAPIAVFVYNRPLHTQQSVEALRRNEFANESDLFIFSDAPRTPDAAVAVQEVRNYVSTVGGFRTVNIVERTQNLGLANSIIDGVTRLCEEYGRVIVVEDDLVTSPYFLEYMNTALERYEKEQRVMQVAGYMFPVKLEIEEDALFLPFISSWGWATWQRAWRQFDVQARGYERLVADNILRNRFDLNGHYDYFKMLHAQQNGKVDSWAIRWYLTVFLCKGIALYPKRTLVHNLGFDGSGVNCGVRDFIQDDLELEFRVTRLPTVIDISISAEGVFNSMPKPRLNLGSIRNRLLSFLTGSRRAHRRSSSVPGKGQ